MLFSKKGVNCISLVNYSASFCREIVSTPQLKSPLMIFRYPTGVKRYCLVKYFSFDLVGMKTGMPEEEAALDQTW